MTTTAAPALTAMTPAEIDALLFPIEAEAGSLWAAAARSRRWARKLVEEGSWTSRRATVGLAEAARLQAKGDAKRAEGAPYDAEYTRRGGWSRYILCLNAGGHVHRSDTRCQTLYPMTDLAMLAEFSGLDEDALVARYGHKCCTICFPSAPASPHWQRTIREEKAAKDARRDEKTAARIAKIEKRIAFQEKAVARNQAKMVKAGYDGDTTVKTLLAEMGPDSNDSENLSNAYIAAGDRDTAAEALVYAKQDLADAMAKVLA